MFGISGVALGAILRAKGYDYVELAKVGGVFALFVAVLAFFINLIPGLNELSMFILAESGVLGQFINEQVLSRWEIGSFVMSIMMAIVSAVFGMVSLLIGGAVLDIAEKIKN